MSQKANFTTTIITMPEWGSTCCVAVPDEVAARFKKAGVSRVICMINQGEHYH